MLPRTARLIHCVMLVLALPFLAYGVLAPWQRGNDFIYRWGRGTWDSAAHISAVAVSLLLAFSLLMLCLGRRRRIIPREACAIAVLFASLGLVATMLAIHRIGLDQSADRVLDLRIFDLTYVGVPPTPDLTLHRTAAPWSCLVGLVLALVGSFAIWQTPASEVDEIT